MSQQFYQEEEAEAILRLAAQKSSGGTVSRANLPATAAELGISPEALEEAERSIVSEKQDLKLRAEYERRVKAEFYTHLVSYVTINLFLVIINLMTTSYPWVIWSFLGWGIGLAIHFGVTFIKSTSTYGAEYEKWKAKHIGQQSSVAHDGQVVIGLSLGTNKRSDP